MPSVVMAMFGIGPASMLRPPMNPADAGDERRTRSRAASARSPIQYAASGATTQATMPGTTAGRYPFSVTRSKYSTAARAR